MSNPVPQDLFSRFQAEMYDEQEIIGVPTAGLAFYGGGGASRTYYSPDSNTVDITIIRGDERVAALIPRGTVSQSLGGLQKNARTERFTEFSRSFPLAQETGDITAANLTTPVAGEPRNNSGVTQRMRFLHHARRIHMENARRLLRLGELLAWQGLLTGKQDAILGTTDTDLQYDFRRNSTHFIQCGVTWLTDTTDILTDIDGGCAKLRANGHVSPDMMVLAADAMAGFVKNKTVKEYADNRRYGFVAMGDGAVMPAKFARFVAGGMVFQGTLRTPQGYELALFTYPEVYTASNGTATKYIPDNKVLLCSSTARCDRFFGPPEMLPMLPSKAALYRETFGFDPYAPPMPSGVKGGIGIPADAFYCQAYHSTDNKRVTMETQCAPIFVPVQTDAFVVFDVVP